jgi:hypothetical protein
MLERVERNQQNQKLLMAKAISKNGAPVFSGENEGPDPYYCAGSHPDIVERVWVELGKNFPSESKCRIFGSPALYNPQTGLVFALCKGTQYCIRVPVSRVEEAKGLGLKESTTWSGGAVTNVSEEYGYGWLFGFWHAREEEFCKEVYESGAA